MIEYINVYMKDDVELSYKEWNDNLNKDIEIENSTKTWDIRPAINSDLANGREVDVNGHSYCQKTNFIYDSAFDVFEAIADEDPYMILDVIKNMSDEKIENIILQIDGIKKVDNKFLCEEI